MARVLEVAYLLGRPEEEILDMPLDQFSRWVCFFKEQNRQATQITQSSASGRGVGTGVGKVPIYYKADRFAKKGLL